MRIEQILDQLTGPPPDMEEMAKEVICNIQQIAADKEIPLAKKILIFRDKVASGELAEMNNLEKIETLKRHDVIGKLVLQEVRSVLAKLEQEQTTQASN